MPCHQYGCLACLCAAMRSACAGVVRLIMRHAYPGCFYFGEVKPPGFVLFVFNRFILAVQAITHKGTCPAIPVVLRAIALNHPALPRQPVPVSFPPRPVHFVFKGRLVHSFPLCLPGSSRAVRSMRAGNAKVIFKSTINIPCVLLLCKKIMNYFNPCKSMIYIEIWETGGFYKFSFVRCD